MDQEEIKQESRIVWTEWKYWKLCLQNFCDAAKVVFREKFIADINNTRKEDEPQNTFTLRKQWKVQIKPKSKKKN